jgi:hypothetical protein
MAFAARKTKACSTPLVRVHQEGIKSGKDHPDSAFVWINS